VNRKARRAAEALRRRLGEPDAAAPDRASLVRMVAEWADRDPSVTGATLIMPDGEVSYIDAGLLRRGGTA